MPQIQSAIYSILKHCLKLRRSESILILSDDPMSKLGEQFYEIAKAYSSKAYLMIIPSIPHHGYEPPKSVASLMNSSNVIILLTSRSLSHTQARRRASKNGARIISLPGVTKETLMRTLTGDYKGIIYRSRKIADILTIGRNALLTSSAGTHLTFSLVRMKGYTDTGMVHESGQFSNIPAGEGCTAPVYGTAQGVLVIDGSFPEIGLIKNPIRMTVKAGYVIRITGSEEAIQVRQLLRRFGRHAKNIAEIGIGTNSKAKLTGCTLEDEKSLGTVHVALGNNISFDGKVAVPCHFDAVLRKPTLVIDGKTILENGEIQV